MNFWDYLNARATRNANVDVLIGRTQRNLSFVVLLVMAWVVWSLFLGPKLDPTVEKLLFTVLGGLLSTLAMQNTFWFGRPRQAGIPDPTAPGTVVESNLNIKQVTPPASVNTGGSADLG